MYNFHFFFFFLWGKVTTYCPYGLLQSSSSSCSLTPVSGEWARFGQSALVRSVGEQPEQSRTKRKTESPSWLRSSDGDSRWVLKAMRNQTSPDTFLTRLYFRNGLNKMYISDSWLMRCFADRTFQECLRLIRNNVVVLLATLLPQLDFTGISMETPDVDSILQQIIEVNQLKLWMLTVPPKCNVFTVVC